MEKEKLQEILSKHLKWLKNEKGGERADLSGSNLRGSDLSCSNLSGSNLSGSNLSGSDLSCSNLSGSDLSYSNLSGSNLSGSDLSDSNLSCSNLRGSDLSCSNLSDSNLSGSNLRGSDLSDSNLRGSDLSDSNLSCSNLRGSDLRGSDLSGSNLRGSDLSDSNLSGSNLRDVKDADKMQDIFISHTSICPEGTIIGWKKCRGNVIVKLEIPAEAKRSNATGRKCRAEYAKVLEVIGADVGISQHDCNTEYRVGEIVKPDKWDDNRWYECSNGIHFFITRLEAENYI